MAGKLFILSVFSSFIVALSSCTDNMDTAITAAEGRAQMYKKYQVHKLIEPMKINADWDKPQWQKAEPLEIRLFMGKEPAHQPRTQAKLLYDDNNIYVIFRVEDRYVRAVASEHHGMVCRDSCVEFFFTLGSDIGDGYFNLETNCIGTILCFHQTGREQNQRKLTAQQLDRIEIATTLPRRVIEPEVPGPVTWTLEYRLPLRILIDYCKLIRPAAGVKWRANFYKCADKTSHPHWLSWSRIDRYIPDFHRPEYFGTLEFAD